MGGWAGLGRLGWMVYKLARLADWPGVGENMSDGPFLVIYLLYGLDETVLMSGAMKGYLFGWMHASSNLDHDL